MDNYKKDSFSSKLGFLASAASAAVGLGNIWRFPYLTGKYGGANFVLVYLFCVFVLGLPLMLAKLAFGRHMKGGTYIAYKKLNSRLWMMPGIFASIAATLVLSFYPIITGWLIGYYFKYLNGSLVQVDDYTVFFKNFVSNFQINLFYTLIALIIVAYIVYRGVTKGIELISEILMPLFVIMLIILIIFATTLEGSVEGIKFYLIPNFSSFSFEGLYAALGQAFASLAVGAGISITYGSYVNKEQNLIKSTFIIILSDTLVAIFAGLIIFPLIFHKGIQPDGGPSLIFISLPLAFKYLGTYMGSFFGGMFFLLLIFAAITSAISIMEVPVKFLMEKFNLQRTIATILIFIISIILSIPSILSFGENKNFSQFFKYKSKIWPFLDFIDLISIDLLMPIVALGFNLMVVKKWGIKSFFNEINIHEEKNKFFSNFLKVSLIYICPGIISFIVFMKIKEVFI